MTLAGDMEGVRECRERQIGIRETAIYLLYLPSCVSLTPAVKVRFLCL